LISSKETLRVVIAKANIIPRLFSLTKVVVVMAGKGQRLSARGRRCSPLVVPACWKPGLSGEPGWKGRNHLPDITGIAFLPVLTTFEACKVFLFEPVSVRCIDLQLAWHRVSSPHYVTCRERGVGVDCG